MISGINLFFLILSLILIIAAIIILDFYPNKRLIFIVFTGIILLSSITAIYSFLFGTADAVISLLLFLFFYKNLVERF